MIFIFKANKTTNDILILGKKGSGKTCTCVYMALMQDSIYNYDHIYSNFPINSAKWKPLYIHQITLWNINQYKNSLIIVDEGLLMVDARRSASKVNKEITETFLQLRKVNCDTMFIAQRIFDIDARVREQVRYYVYPRKKLLHDADNHVVFTLSIYDSEEQRWSKKKFLGNPIFGVYNTNDIVSNVKRLGEFIDKPTETKKDSDIIV